MGKQTMLDVVFDTGSDWLVIEGASCSNCSGDTYNIEPALRSGQATQLTISAHEREYGSAKVVGREYSDTVCIELASCVFNFRFFYVESQTGLAEPVDGILGLSRSRPMILGSKNGAEIGPLYVLALSS